MKRLFTLFVLVTAFIGNAMAWEPVIKETHWFTLLEDYGAGGYTMDAIDFDGNYIRSISGKKEWDGQSGENKHHPKISYYSWLDHQYRFKANIPGFWVVDKNNSTNYSGPGLKNNRTDGNGTNFWVLNLKQGDKFNIEYYRDPNNGNSPFLVSGSVEGLTPAESYSAANAVYGANDNGLVYYTMTADGDVQINIPAQTVIRSVSIVHKEYKKATYETKQITDNGNIGYETTLTGSGVLEDKRGAVPYITMRFGNENDQTFVRDLGEAYGARRYGAAGIVNENNDFNFSSAGLQHRFSGMSTDQVKKLLSNKEWTVFTCEQETVTDDNGQQRVQDNFNSIYPNYGSYYYFFPEVDGKLNVKFYCEGEKEHMAFWYKRRADGSFPGVGEQPSKIAPSSNDNSNNQDYYEYTVNVEKGGVYYLCSNPTIVEHQQPIIRLVSYSFVPTFRVDPLYKVVDNATTSVSGAATIKGVTISEFTGIQSDNSFNNNATIKINGEDAPIVKFLGRVNGAKVSLRQEGDDIKLDFSNITYENGADINQGGAIVVNLDCPAGKATFVLTIAYKAAKAEWGVDTEGNVLRVATNETGNVEVKRWDFYSGKGEYGATEWDLGKYSNESSKLYKEVHKADGLTADWVDTYVDVQKSEERIFKSVYDMEGDNADMIHETAGLVFHTAANQMGIFNENEAPTSGFQDRYIGLMNGSKLVIPRLQADDRVVIKMGSFGNADDAVTNKPATLTLTNAKDAKGTDISGDYVIGGSIPYEGETDPHGEYHFKVKETSKSDATDFAIEVKDADLLKIYSIVIYRNAADNNAEILTENQLIGEQQEVTFTDDDASTAEKTVDAHVRYHGYQEKSTFDDIDQVRGNLNLSKSNFTVTTSDAEPYCTISTTVKKGNFGSFRAKMEVLTKDANNTYVTDYVPGSLAVGLLEKVKDGYPYTWDFTDLLKLECNNSTYIHDAIDFEKNAENLLSDYNGWELYNGESLRNAPKNASGILFADGGQLYAKNVMFEETAGIGFKRSTDNVEDAKLLNRSVRIRDGALILNCNEEGKFHKMVLPKVDADAVIYVRATPIENAKLKNQCSTDGQTGKNFDKTLTIGDDKVFIMKNNAEQNIELWLNGYEIHKISVSRDPKTVNVKGYASESRDHRIDHSLTKYFTGANVKAYVVQGADYDNRTLTLFDIASDDASILAAEQGCIIGTNDEKLEIIDGGFHLFVPDMHDTGNYLHGKYGNMLVANVDDEGKLLGMFDGDNTNYALTYRYQMLKEDGTPYGDVIEGDEMFYRVSKNGIKLHKNSAYLQLPTSEVKPSPSRPAGCPMFSFIFTELDEGETVITGIEEVGVFIEDKEDNAVWYNLNGQKLNGKPSARGIYIRNGKKVFVK